MGKYTDYIVEQNIKGEVEFIRGKYYAESIRQKAMKSFSMDSDQVLPKKTIDDRDIDGSHDSLEEFFENHEPSYMWLNGDFYKKLEDKLFIRCETFDQFRSTEFETDFGHADEEKLKSTDREKIDFR